MNKRTRTAMSAASEGKLEKGAEQTLEYLMKIVQDTKREDSVRLQAANVLLPYVKPRLASIEQTTIDDRDKMSDAEIMESLRATVTQSPEIVEQVVSVAVEASPELRERLIRLLQQPVAVGQLGDANAAPGTLH